MAIRPLGYYSYGGQTPQSKPYVPPAPKLPPIQYTGPTGFSPGYGPGAVPSSADYLSFGGSTPSVGSYVPKLPGGVAQGQGGGGGGGGGDTVTTTVQTPNQVYEADILGDPMSRAAQQSYDASVQGLANNRRDQIRQASIAAGYTPTLTGALSQYAGDVDQATLDAAGANQLSARAQLNKALNQANYDLPYILAATGMGRSGSLATGTTALQEQYQQNAQQGLDALNKSLLGYGSDYASGFNTAVQNLNAARAAVADRLARQAGFSQTVTTRGGGGGTTDTADGGYNPGDYAESPGNQELTDFVQSLQGQTLPPPSAFQSNRSLVYKPGTYSATQKVLQRVRR